MLTSVLVEANYARLSAQLNYGSQFYWSKEQS